MVSPEALHKLPETKEAIPVPRERERKFLLNTLPENLSEFPHQTIHQGYLFITDTSEIRLRQAGDDYFQTIKVGEGEERDEREIPFTREQFDTLWFVTEGKRLTKERYKLPYEGKTIEVDVYQDTLEGLVVAEVEFKNKAESEAFVSPIWFGVEVTNDKAFKNQSLAVHGLPAHLDELLGKKEADKGLVVEKSLQEGVENLMGLIDERRETTSGEPIFVHIAGRTSAGKSTAVTEQIMKKYVSDIGLLSMDDYSKGNIFLAQEAEKGNVYNWDHPAYMDFTLLADHLSALKRGESIEKPVFSFKTGEREGREIFEPKPIIIVEGLFALRDEIAHFGDVKSFVDISLHGSIVRRLLRDVQRTGMHPADILRYYLETVEPMYQQHIVQTKENADLILVNEYNPVNEAGKAGMFEVQTKFAGTLDEEALRKVGAERLGIIRQQDFYLRPVDKDLKESDESIRIRQEAGKSVLSYKGPRLGDEIRVRPKFEFVIDEETENIFFEVYGERFKEVDKIRTLYKFNDTIISLDFVTIKEGTGMEILGDFIEVRCDREKAAEQLQEVYEKLGLDPESRTNRSYGEM